MTSQANTGTRYRSFGIATVTSSYDAQIGEKPPIFSADILTGDLN